MFQNGCLVLNDLYKLFSEINVPKKEKKKGFNP